MEQKTWDPMTEPMFYVLMAFLEQPRCGTEIAAYAERRTAGRVMLGPGTLYTILAKFQADGLIQETSVLGRKRTYHLTKLGGARFQAEQKRLKLCLGDATAAEEEARAAAERAAGREGAQWA